MKKLLTTILLSVACLVAGAETAADVLAKVKSAVASAPSIEAKFTINGADGTIGGTATIAGERYFMTTPVLTVWYDGRTQWTYLKNTDEVSITEPEVEELLTSNPFAILTTAADSYSLKNLPSAGGRKRVQLKPLSAASPVESIVLTIDGTTSMPSAIKVGFDDGNTIDLNISKIERGQAKPISTFRYNAARWPAKEVIDLR